MYRKYIVLLTVLVLLGTFGCSKKRCPTSQTSHGGLEMAANQQAVIIEHCGG